MLCGCGEMADTHGSGPCEETHAGSTPVNRTKKISLQAYFFVIYDLFMKYMI